MLTINKLTKTFASGSLAIGVATLASLAGSTLLAPSAHAAPLTYTLDELAGFGADGVTLGDKKFYDFAYDPIVEGGDTIKITQVGDIYQVLWDASTGATNVFDGPPGTTGSFSYKIDILDPLKFFDSVAFDVDQNSSTTGVKEVTGVSPLISTNGSSIDFTPIPGHLKTISVKDTYTINDDDGFVNGSSNKFKQGKSVPEPSAVLGLLAIGGLGLVSLKRKQS